jgi:Glycosyltransferase family 28 N-terminal domain
MLDPIEARYMTGKRIVFCTFGPLGDIYPLLALARELRLRGHWPVIATSPTYRGLIESKNIGFHPVRPDINARRFPARPSGRDAVGLGRARAGGRSEPCCGPATCWSGWFAKLTT